MERRVRAARRGGGACAVEISRQGFCWRSASRCCSRQPPWRARRPRRLVRRPRPPRPQACRARPTGVRTCTESGTSARLRRCSGRPSWRGKEVLTDQEAAEFEVKNQRNQDNRESAPAGVVNGQASNRDVERAYNDFWWDFGKKTVSTQAYVAGDRSARRPYSGFDARGAETSRRPA